MAQDNTQEPPRGDSPKRHGDPLGAGTEAALASGGAKPSGDSPKRQGDKMAHAAKEAAKPSRS